MKTRVGVFTKVDTVIVRVRDLAAARAWYEETLGLRAGYVSEEERLVVFEVARNGTTFTIWELKPGQRLAPADAEGTYPILFADDLAHARAALAGRGVPVSDIEGDGVRWFTMRDPDGNKLEVVHY